LGRDNHQRVVLLKEALQERGIITWIDTDNMKDNLRHCMSQGLNESMSIIYFITKKYEEKINGGDNTDDCLFELNAASKNPTLANNRIVISMEKCMLNPREWQAGRLKDELCLHLFIDMSEDDLIVAIADKIVSDLTQKFSNGKYFRFSGEAELNKPLLIGNK
jgi:hypothetical protein